MCVVFVDLLTEKGRDMRRMCMDVPCANLLGQSSIYICGQAGSM